MKVILSLCPPWRYMWDWRYISTNSKRRHETEMDGEVHEHPLYSRGGIHRGRVQLKLDGTREGKWRGNWRMEWVASTKSVLHTTSELGVSSITNADAHTSAASSRLNWRTCLFKWTRPFRWKTKSGFCACAITFQTQYTHWIGGSVGPRGGLHA
jgi:hypothetical protein